MKKLFPIIATSLCLSIFSGSIGASFFAFQHRQDNFAQASAFEVFNQADTCFAENEKEEKKQVNLHLSNKSAYCMDADTCTLVYAKEENKRLPIASMCKIMTLILCFDAIDQGKISLNENVSVSKNAMSMGGSQVFLNAGTEYPLEKLIESIIVCSANDSCVAVAEKLSGSVELFVDQMNERAKKLGCENTLFANCTGLPKDPQYSCAKDVALMLRELIRHDVYFKYSKLRIDEFKHDEGRSTLMTNTNRLVQRYQGCDGGKTGFTQEAGFCLAATAKRGNMRLISISIGSSDSEARFSAVSSLLDYGFANFTNKIIIDGANVISDNLSVRGSRQRVITVIPSRCGSVFSPRGEENSAITVQYNFLPVKAPIAKGTVVGEAIIYKDNVEYSRVPLLANESAEVATVWDSYREIAENWNL